MALNIKDVETDRLVRELASLTGESITVAIRGAVLDRLARVRAERANGDRDGAELFAIIARGRARRLLDDRADADILGYDEAGLPS